MSSRNLLHTTDDNEFFGLQDLNDDVFTPPVNDSGFTQEQDLLLEDAYSGHGGRRTPSSHLPFDSQTKSEKGEGPSDESTNRVLD